MRVRFAPSPTGALHVGTVRTALYDWILARKTGGRFILRIEDTDQERFVPEAEQIIFESLRWIGLDWDEGPGVGGPHAPYVQTQRRELYQAAARRLIESGAAYECDCSPERLEEVRKKQEALKLAPGYDGKCRRRDPAELAESRRQGRPVVVRMKLPPAGDVSFVDLVRGKVTFSWATMSDFVILKSDGLPTYHLAVVVDDHDMKITHVLRGEEWIASTPRHVLIHEKLGYQMPVMVHLPLLLAPDRSKLSKRHGATSVNEFRDAGFLPEAMFNFLALMGWSPGDDREVMTRQEIVDAFSLDRIKDSPAIFDRTKLEWMNGVYIRQLTPRQLAERLIPFLEQSPGGLPPSVPRPLDIGYLEKSVPLVQDRLKTLRDAADLIDFLYAPEIRPEPAEVVQKGMTVATTASSLGRSLQVLREAEPFEHPVLDARHRALAEELGLKTGQLFGALRVAITGKKVAPPLFETMEVLGRKLCVERVERAIDALGRSEARA
ncbi:MAG: glutamate--tRNA ligase [Chloroflexi bacterium]|nr:glutamate--tRNA ligase [Chloroflexota bacterium]